MIAIEELNKAIKDMAISKGLCEQWKTEWNKDWDQEELVKKFYKGLDFFLSTRFLSNEFIVNNFDIDFLRRKNILVDDTYSLTNPPEAILIGESTSTIRVNAYNTSTIYVCDDSGITLAAKNRSFVIVHLLGNARLNAMQFDKAYICAIIHSENAEIITKDNIVIKKELTYLS